MERHAKTKIKYVPALKYPLLTSFFDFVTQITLPEKRFRTSLVYQTGNKAGDRVLDFGAGTAALLLLLKQFAPQAKFTGVDIDEKIISIAEEKIKSAKADINMDRYGGVTLPYPDGYFDRVVSSLVFHHLTKEQKENAFQEIRRVLANGGELHVADWGKAQTLTQRVMFLAVQMLDGFETTTDNIEGLLPIFMTNAGFVDVRETERIPTAFGVLSLYKAISA
jgi:ubiquinone/menaquinone biosynthesis C-methylase UbiE